MCFSFQLGNGTSRKGQILSLQVRKLKGYTVFCEKKFPSESGLDTRKLRTGQGRKTKVYTRYESNLTDHAGHLLQLSEFCLFEHNLFSK